MEEAFDELIATTRFWTKYLSFQEESKGFLAKQDPRETILIASGMSKAPYNAFLIKGKDVGILAV